MKESTSFSQLKNRGSVLFIYSDKMHIYVIYHDLEGDRIYKFVCDKQLIIESAHELKVPEHFMDYTDLHWHKPTLRGGDFHYSGAVVINGKTHTFQINDVDELIVSTEVCSPNVFSLLPMDSLTDIEVEFHIQKSNKLYAIGYHKQTTQQVFVLVDIAQDKILREYTLSSGLGEIIANTINIDQTDSRVYVGGHIRSPETKETIQPYFESFLMLGA